MFGLVTKKKYDEMKRSGLRTCEVLKDQLRKTEAELDGVVKANRILKHDLNALRKAQAEHDAIPTCKGCKREDKYTDTCRRCASYPKLKSKWEPKEPDDGQG